MDHINHKVLGKIFGDFNKVDEFKAKIDNAKKVREYAQANIAINI